MMITSYRLRESLKPPRSRRRSLPHPSPNVTRSIDLKQVIDRPLPQDAFELEVGSVLAVEAITVRWRLPNVPGERLTENVGPQAQRQSRRIFRSLASARFRNEDPPVEAACLQPLRPQAEAAAIEIQHADLRAATVDERFHGKP